MKTGCGRCAVRSGQLFGSAFICKGALRHIQFAAFQVNAGISQCFIVPLSASGPRDSGEQNGRLVRLLLYNRHRPSSCRCSSMEFLRLVVTKMMGTSVFFDIPADLQAVGFGSWMSRRIRSGAVSSTRRGISEKSSAASACTKHFQSVSVPGEYLSRLHTIKMRYK